MKTTLPILTSRKLSLRLPQHFAALSLCWLLGSTANSSAQNLRLWTESASDLNGPWTRVDPAAHAADADGNPVIPVGREKMFFRTRLDDSGATFEGYPILFANAPADAKARAVKFLYDGSHNPSADASGAINPEFNFEEWPGDAEIAPCVMPVYDLAVNEGRTPAYLEFKVQGARVAADKGPFPNSFADCENDDLGYILISLHEGDSPVAASSGRGKTPVEQLQCMARTKRLKVFRFGSTFLTAESPEGRVMANLGDAPTAINPDLATTLLTDQVWTGEGEQDVRPTALPPMRPGGFASYDAFLADYKTNAALVARRAKMKRDVADEWAAEKGNLPMRTISMTLGQSNLPVLAGPPAHWSFESEELLPAVKVAAGVGGGVVLTANAVGGGLLRVEENGVVTNFAVTVGPAAGVAGKSAKSPVAGAAFVPGWQPWHTTVLAGGKDDQPKYFQSKDSDWCPYVGCGPLAWAMLFSWFEHHGVPGAFGSPFTITSPMNMDSLANRSAVYPELKLLHDYCDVLCNPFGDAGATTPANQSEGFFDYIYPNRSILHMIDASWHMRWSGLGSTLDTEGGGSECRSAVMKGYPAVAGIGAYTHYVLVFGYRWQEFTASPNGPAFLYRRQIFCNMGWGSQHEPEWRSLYDVFFSSDNKLVKGPLAPAQP